MRSRLIALALVTAVVGLLVGVAFSIGHAQSQSRGQLEQRFDLRASLGATFSSTFMRSIAYAEQRRAEQTLAGAAVSDAAFQQTVSAGGFRAAVLVNRYGRLLKVWPPKPALLGSPIARKYAHLRAATAGRIAISNVVPSAARGMAVVAVAVPYRSPEGRRVFSGAFPVGDTPLGAYLNSSVYLRHGESFLVDGAGSIIAANQTVGLRGGLLSKFDPVLVSAAKARDHGYYRDGNESRYFVRRAIAGTPWLLVASAPRDQIFGPIGGWKTLLPWLLFAALAVTALGLLVLLGRLVEQRHRLAEANEELAARNEGLREVDRLKDDFVALVSHELRTPLTSILGFVDLLLRERAGVVPVEQRRSLEIVERNAQRLVLLVSDLLLAAKADSGKLELEPTDLDLAVLVTECVESGRPHADGQDVLLSVDLDSSVSVHADRARIGQVVDNLLSNAIKFTPPGGEISVRLTTVAGQALIEITDTGIGVPRSEQANLFDRFFRASSATRREIQGSGLGLSIAKTIVELHKGQIEVSSEEGKGTTVRVWLPARTNLLAEAAA